MSDLTIVDIAELAGVSVSTVSRVINKHPDVSAATTKRILAIIKEHGYVPNASARNLKRESAKAIGVVIKGFTNPVFTTMLQVIQQEIERNGYTLIMAQVDPDEDEVAIAISLCKEKKPRGLIFMGGNFRHSQDSLAKLEAPYAMLTIALQGGADRAKYSSVTVDDFEAGRKVADIIYAAGHRQVVVMGSRADDISISRLRIEGFKKGWEAHGLTLDEKRIAYSGAFTYKAGFDAAAALLGQLPFTCLFCVSDIQAIGAMRAIHAAGYQMPADISVLGFDGIEEGLYHIPSLATMRQPFAEMANTVVRILLDNIRGGAEHAHVLFEAELRAGESFASRDGAIGEGC